jgi:hypothetical protein
MVTELLAEGGVRFADGTLLSCANYPGYASRSYLAGDAAYATAPPRASSWVMRLVVICDPKGVPGRL